MPDPTDDRRPDPDPLDELDGGEADEALDEADPLLSPEVWEDDDEDPLTAALLEEGAAELAGPADLVLDDELPDDDDDEDGLRDLDLADTVHDGEDEHAFAIESVAGEALPVIPLKLEVEVDGRRVLARVDPGLEVTRLAEPASECEDPARQPGFREVFLQIRGTLLRARVKVEPAAAPSLVLGLDVLRSRFLLRP